MSGVVWKDRVALVTGASSGIGAEFARQIAQKGARLVLVARSGEKLQKLATGLESLSGHAPVVIPMDLSEPGAARKLFDATQERDLEVEHLINNAGVGRAYPVHKDSAERLGRLVTLNCTALTELTNLYVGQMVGRGSGGILQVASLVSFSTQPFMSAYAASKHYVRVFTEGLAIELEGTGVTTTAVCPGQVNTGFQAAAGFGDQEMDLPGEMSAAETARRGLRAYEKGKVVHIPGVMNNLAAFFMGLLPRSWVARISANVLKKLGRFD